MEQNGSKTNYYACIGLYDYIEAGISFNKSVYELSDEELNLVNYMYCRNLADGTIMVINQAFIRDILNDPDTFIINKYDGLYTPNEFYTLSDLLADIKANESDDSIIKRVLSEVASEFNRERKTKIK